MGKHIDYIERTRQYYRAQGFEKDYVWAHHQDTPFTRLARPLAKCRVTIVTTAVSNPQIPKPTRAAESISFADLPERLDTSEVSWDKETTHTDDRRSYFPLEDLKKLAEEGVIGDLAPRYHFVPTQYSHRATTEEDAPAIAAACIEDEVDIAILVPL